MDNKALIILIAGPYRSGTNDDPKLMEENLRRMEEAALVIFRAGHIPVVGEWYALPLLKMAGSKYPGDAIYEEISYPIARRIITRADAILRIEGASKGADGDVEKAKSLGIPVYYKAEDIPGLFNKRNFNSLYLLLTGKRHPSLTSNTNCCVPIAHFLLVDIYRHKKTSAI